MRISHEELKDLFKRFRWIDNIPEDQEKRDEICLKAKAALLLEANMNSEMFPAFLRGKKVVTLNFFTKLISPSAFSGSNGSPPSKVIPA